MLPALQSQPLFLVPSAYAGAARALASIFAADPAHLKTLYRPSYVQNPDTGVVRVDVSGLILKGVGGSIPGCIFDLDEIHAAAGLAQASGSDLHLRIESGGGSVSGVPEAGAAIARARAAGCRTLAFSECIMGSAAYWLGSACEVVAAAPTALVGSVGVYTVVEDFSKMLEASGVVVHVLRSGSLKGAGIPGAPVTAEELAHLQSRVDSLTDQFFNHVASARAHANLQAGHVFSGGAWLGDDALALGLLDAVEDTEARLLAALALAAETSRPL